MAQEECGGDSGPSRHFISTKAGQRIPTGMIGNGVARGHSDWMGGVARGGEDGGGRGRNTKYTTERQKMVLTGRNYGRGGEETKNRKGRSKEAHRGFKGKANSRSASSGEENKVLRWMFLAWCRCRFSRPLRRQLIPSGDVTDDQLLSDAAALHRRPSLFFLTCSIQPVSHSQFAFCYLSHLPARLSLVGPSGTSPGFKPSPFSSSPSGQLHNH
ncbi:hypothetical protein ASPNIDRAFT_39259 [Aspergillus niger ATCC 1015]|uniref:Uncharacterized protein n=1 Tax=Aspergillus niger (strain ATCC 1015 / CBS 113.46 / FGSC A1144 / LSHB Ac4 / NCTC 3858a / NRRL 328 / USDA 3528.7) TaxID=380704 RepID=G3YAW5_ASPNA|nr:hypothetical protein ASPNIDRAFT_39259 [Aspergillus niger ATCC 1015]